MHQNEKTLKLARYLIFETLEMLLIPLTAVLSLLGQGGALYLFSASQEAVIYQENIPDAGQWSAIIGIGLFLTAWYFVFYFWRRRAGMIRLIGQCIHLIWPLAASVLWLMLGISAWCNAREAFFAVIPPVMAALSVLTLIWVILPIPALIRWQRLQYSLTGKEK